ncbi:MAG: DMT family transporter [Chloroflexi bacterium]|nr:DMT family transporter [Chloroflexota bacterium]
MNIQLKRAGERESGRAGENSTSAQSLNRSIAQSPRLRVAVPYLTLILGLASIGLSAIFVKWANAPGAVSGFYRMAIAAAVMTIPFAISLRRAQLPITNYHLLFTNRHVLFAIIAGLFFAGDLATWNTAVLIGNAANATLFGNTAPVWVSFGALILFKEKLRPAFWGGLLFAMLGAGVILGGDFLQHPQIGIGDLLGLLVGFFYGMFFLATERARDQLSSLVSWWISAAVCALALLALSIVFNQPLTGYPLETWINLVVLALVVQVIGWLLLNYALGHLPASIVAPTLLMQPVLTAIFGVPLLGQPISFVQIIGGGLTLAGIFIVHIAKQKGERG